MIKERLQSADLRPLQVLQDLSAAQLNQLSRNMSVVNVRKGEVIYRPGQVAENLYLVLDGEIGNWSISARKQGKLSPPRHAGSG
jgi:CRP-like cAMP-binding protein